MFFNSKKSSKNFKKIIKTLKKNYKTLTKNYNKSSIWLKLFFIIALVLVFIKRYNV